MTLHFSGIIIAISTFVCIGFFHPLVIKAEYYLGTRIWWVFLVVGVGMCGVALFVSNIILSSVVGVVGASCLWSIYELFLQKRRVERGWFPMNHRRKGEYKTNGLEGE